VASIHHSERAAICFGTAEPELAGRALENSHRVRGVAEQVIADRLEVMLAHVAGKELRSEHRFGAPLGLGVLARSPYRDEDDLWLVEDFALPLQNIASDAAGTLALGRHLLRDSQSIAVRMPRWGASTPDAAVQLRHAAVRQFWSTIEKVAWLVNKAFDVQIADRDCSFANLFRDKKKALRTKLVRRNPGLRALAAMSTSFDVEMPGVYAPLKRLRNTVEHRGPDQTATPDDAAFLLGIARAALLHAIDAVVFDRAASVSVP
jgi:hypothetical protein